MGFLRFTKNMIENMKTFKLDLIPFLLTDLTRGKDYYVYVVKNRFKKDTNRLYTTLLSAFRVDVLKNDSGVSRQPHRLVLITDNYVFKEQEQRLTLFPFSASVP